MKKFLSILFLFSMILSANTVFADTLNAPVVSIGVGNGNSPENSGPVSGNTYNGNISVYATVSDTDLDNYHFRIIKDGGVDGFTCVGEGALFLAENQGYASTTLGKTACGFVYNQSVYVTPTGFTNTVIATINTSDLIAYSGEGEYWFILGARDSAGNRTNANYLSDSRVKVVVSATPIIENPPVQPVASSGGGGGGNGPIAGTFGAVTTNQNSGSQNTTNNVVTNTNSNNSVSVTNSPVVSQNKTVTTEQLALNSDDGVISTEVMVGGNEGEVSTSSSADSNLAQVVKTGFNFNWLWLVLVVILGGGIYYYSKKD